MDETIKRFLDEHRRLLEGSRVNLGRTDAKTRHDFIEAVCKHAEEFLRTITLGMNLADHPPPRERFKDRLVPQKKKPKSKLTQGGVTQMTEKESMRADEELNRSPYTTRRDKRG